MANRYTVLKTAAGELTAHAEEQIMQGLVTAGALVALADGEVKTIERAELVDFIDRQGFVPTISREDIAETFDSRVRGLKGRCYADIIIENLRPLSGQSLASVVVRTAQKVAGADQEINPSELRALKLLRRIMISLPAIGPIPCPLPLTPADCEHCGTALFSPIWSERVTLQEDVPDRHCLICGQQIETFQNRAGRALPNELVQAFFPSLLVA